MSQRILLNGTDENDPFRTTRTIRIEGASLVIEHGWAGVGSSRKTLPIPDVTCLVDSDLVDAILAGTMPGLSVNGRVELFGPYEEITHDNDDLPQGRTPTVETKTGMLHLCREEAQAIIAYFLIPPPREALTPGALDAIRTGTLDPEGFYELAIPVQPPNALCRAEAFAWTMGLVLERFRNRYV